MILIALGIILLIAWGVLWLGFHVASGIVHLLVLAAVVFFVWGLVTRGANAVGRHM